MAAATRPDGWVSPLLGAATGALALLTEERKCRLKTGLLRPQLVIALSDHLVSSDCRAVYGDPFASVADFNIVPLVSDTPLCPHGAAAPNSGSPATRHRGRAPLSSTRYLCRDTAAFLQNRLHGELIFIPADQHLFVRCAMDPRQFATCPA
jgi:hypothetical protein